MKTKLLILLAFLACFTAIGQTGFKVSQYPLINNIPTNYLILLANPGVSNYSATMRTLYLNTQTNLSGLNGAQVLSSNSWFLATNSVGTVQTNTSVASVTNAGTMAYSNATTFVPYIITQSASTNYAFVTTSTRFITG